MKTAAAGHSQSAAADDDEHRPAAAGNGPELLYQGERRLSQPHHDGTAPDFNIPALSSSSRA